jgi:hypothetical protein
VVERRQNSISQWPQKYLGKEQAPGRKFHEYISSRKVCMASSSLRRQPHLPKETSTLAYEDDHIMPKRHHHFPEETSTSPRGSMNISLRRRTHLPKEAQAFPQEDKHISSGWHHHFLRETTTFSRGNTNISPHKPYFEWLCIYLGRQSHLPMD